KEAGKQDASPQAQRGVDWYACQRNQERGQCVCSCLLQLLGQSGLMQGQTPQHSLLAEVATGFPLTPERQSRTRRATDTVVVLPLSGDGRMTCPHPPENRLQPDAVFIKSPYLHFCFWISLLDSCNFRGEVVLECLLLVLISF